MLLEERAFLRTRELHVEWALFFKAQMFFDVLIARKQLDFYG